MFKEIKQLIQSIDVKNNIEEAESNVRATLKSGPDVIDMLTKIGRQVYLKEYDIQKKKKYLRAIIFSMAILAEKDTPDFLTHAADSTAIDLLFDLSNQGYQSAAKLLYDMGISHSDLLKKKLSALPLDDRHRHDKDISLNEAIEEIKLSKSFSGSKGFTPNYYSLGKDDRQAHEIYRTGKKNFALRVRKIK